MGYRTLLQHAEDIEVVAEASSGEAACSKYAEVQPDAVIMDLSLPGMSGLEAIRRITGRDPEARILAFSMHEDAIFAEQSLQAGARGYLPKSSAPEVMIKALQRIARGGIYLDADLAQHLAYQKIRDHDTPFIDFYWSIRRARWIMGIGCGYCSTARYGTGCSYTRGLPNK
jgi:two-component system, NarL family, invasion response regulator UvrY